MPKALVKCLYCGEQFDRNDSSIEFVKINTRRYAHKSCAEEHEKNLTQEEKDLEALYKYIKDLLKDEYNFIKIKQQIEEFHKDYNYTYSGMLASLKWFYEINHHSIDKSNGGIGIIPYIYNDAKKYYYNIWLAQQKNQNIVNYKVQIQEISIPSPRMDVRPPLRLFNLDDEEES